MDLEAVTQDFVSDMTRYLAGMDAAIARAVEFATASKEAEDAVVSMALAADDAAVTIAAAMNAATASVHGLRDAYLGAAAAAGGLRGASGDLGNAGGVAATDAALARLASIELELSVQTQILRASLDSMRDTTATLTLGLTYLDARLADIAAASTATAAGVSDLSDRMRDLAIATAAAAAAGDTYHIRIAEAGATTVLAGAAAATAGARFRLLGFGFGLTGNAIHWIIAGLTEFLAVAIPATVAGVAWADVWLQGSVNVYQHIMAVYTATEAMANMGAKTAGQMLGLGHALQTAQNEANPNVYQALGSAILIVKESAGGLAKTGLQVGRIFDTFMARLVYDFSAAGGGAKELHGLLADMVPDLVKFGQIFGNLGHFIASFASQMPGLAELLLTVLDGFTRLIAVLADFASAIHLGRWSVLTLAMAFEEFIRWGGLLVGMFIRLGVAIPAVEGAFFSMARVTSVFTGLFMVIPTIIGNTVRMLGVLMMELGGLPEILGIDSLAFVTFGEAIVDAAAALTPFQMFLVTAAAVGLGILIDKLATARTSAQEFADSLQTAVQKASDLSVLPEIASNLATLSARSDQATASMQKYAAGATYAGGVTGRYTNTVTAQQYAYQQAAMAQAAYSSGQLRQIQDAGNVVKGAEQIAQAFHVSIPQAMALAQTAGVNLTGALKTQSGAWTALGDKVRSAYQGFQAMGQGAGMIGNDMLAVAIQTGLAGTKVSQLNQAWDAFMQDLTGGTSALAAFNQSLTNLSTGTNTVTNILGKAGSITLSARQFAQDLTTYTGKGAQAWQNFDQVVGSSAPQLIDWLRTAGAAGVLSQGQFTRAIEGTISQLIPLAAKSKTAQAEVMGLAQQAGLNVTSWAALKEEVKQSGASIADTGKIVSAATIALGNMAAVAQNLGDVMSSQVTAAISNAALRSAGFYRDLGYLSQAMKTGSADGHDAAYWAEQMGTAYSVAGDRAQTAAGKMEKGAATSAGSVKGMAATVEASVGAATKSVDALAIAIAGIHSKTVYITAVDNQITKHARGTASAAPGLAMVGEEGPELVVMHGGEHVFTARHTASLIAMAGLAKQAHGYAAGTQSSTALMDQLTRELSVLAMRLTAASSISGISQYLHNLLSTLKQLASAGTISKSSESGMVALIGADNKRLDHLFTERAKILAKIKKADQYAAAVSQAAQSSASLSTIMQGAGGAPVSSSYLLASMRIDLAGIRRFDADIKRLERMGLDRALLNQIIQMGPAQGDQVAQALISGPLSNIKALNATESQVQKASKNLGRTTADRMFDAGRYAGKGFLSGLEGEQHAIEALMEKIARDMVRTLKHELGIHSPSSVTREMGRNLMDGIPLGVADRMPSLDSSLRSAAGHVTSALSSAAGGSSGGGGDIVIHNHVLVPLPSSRQQYQEIQTQSLRVNRRNPDNRLALTRGRGGR